MNRDKETGKIIIAILGVVFGLTAGYFLVQGFKNVTPVAQALVSSINLFDTKEVYIKDDNQEELFTDKEGKDVYFLEKDKSYLISNNAPIPYLTADSYLVGDIESGEIILSKNENKALPIASISKLMTAVVADEVLGLDSKVKVSAQALDTYGKQGNLKKDEVYKVSEMLYPLLLESSNDAAEVLAESYSRDKFLKAMNEKSREIEMFNTHFGDPSGLSPLNVSSVSDLFKLLMDIESSKDYIYEITRNKKHELGNKVWFSNSKFRSDDDYYAGKNGYTDIALKTQVAIFKINFDGEIKKVAFIILKTDDIPGDIYGLKRYVERHVSYE